MKISAPFNLGSLVVLLFVAMTCATPIEAAPKGGGPSNTVDESDLNDDSLVDQADLLIFSTDYLKEDIDAVDWCGFYVGTRGEARLYNKWPDYYLKHFSRLLTFIYHEFGCDGSDLNWDGQVNNDDLFIFSVRELEQSFESVEWCQVYEYTMLGLRVYDKFSGYYQRHYKLLLGYMYDVFGCNDDFLTFVPQNDPKHLSRIALDDDYSGEYFVSDPVVGSVFIFDANGMLTGELKNLQKPLGLAIDTQGFLLVGNDKSNLIEVYDPATGDLLHSFGNGELRMPTAITIGPAGEIYVTDSKSHRVWVFDSSYDSVPIRTIGSGGPGDGQLKFPVDTAIIARDVEGSLVHEVFVADQRNHRIQVFDLHGNFLRTLDPPEVEVPVEPDPNVEYWWGCGFRSPPPGEVCPPEPRIRGSYTRLHSLDSDTSGRLHVLDAFDANTVIVDPVSGAYIDVYGDWGDGPGLLKVPMDLLINGWDEAIVSDSDSNELEVFAVP